MDRRRYLVSLTFRLALIILAFLIFVCALYIAPGSVRAWSLAILLGFSAAVLQIRPLVVPRGTDGTALYSLGPAFFLAGLFLLPPGPLVASVAFAIALSGLVTGVRPHKVLFNLSLSLLTYGAFSLFLRLGPRGVDAPLPPPDMIGVEALLCAAVLAAQLLVRSVAIRLERGDQAPHWGAFQHAALMESAYCIALSVLISVLARIHVALLVFAYAHIAATWTFVERYRRHVRSLTSAAALMTAPAREEEQRWVA